MQSSSLPSNKETSSDLIHKKDTSFNTGQAYLIALAQRRIGTIFAELPPKMIHHICTVANPNPRLQKALHHAAFGELAALKAMLEEAKQEGEETLKLLLLPTETTETPGGLIVKNTTLLECAALAGDREIVAMIKPYFSEVNEESKEGMEREKERQLARCKRCIDAMETQQAEDLTELFNVIVKASALDVAEELKTGDQYDPTYQSPLRMALNEWRQAKLDTSNRVIDVLRRPRMFCNYQNWVHVNEYLDTEWDRNQWSDLKLNGNNNNKINLILRQLRGFIELTELPAYERFAFANDQVATTGEITRSFKCKHGNSSFPNFDMDAVVSRVGPGFDSYMSIFGRRLLPWHKFEWYPAWDRTSFQIYVEQKLQTCRTYAAATTPSSNSEQACNRLK